MFQLVSDLTSPFPRTMAYGCPVPRRSLESNSTERSFAKRAEYLKMPHGTKGIWFKSAGEPAAPAPARGEEREEYSAWRERMGATLYFGVGRLCDFR